MFKRNDGPYLVRVHVPTDLRPVLGCREIWRSTKTDDSHTAKSREALIDAHFGALFAYLRQHGRRMDRNELDEVVRRYKLAKVEAIEESIALHAGPTGEAGREIWQDRLIEQLEELEAAKERHDFRPVEAEAKTLAPNASESIYRVLCLRLLEAKHEALWLELRAIQGQSLTPARMALQPASMAPAAAPAATPAPSGPLLSAVCADYLRDTKLRKKWEDKTEEANRLCLRYLVEILGDQPIDGIRPKMLAEAASVIPQIPSNVTKRYKGQTIPEAIAQADKAKDEDRLAARTQNKSVIQWKAVFSYAEGLELVARSPAAHLREFSGDAKETKTFTPDQLADFMRLLMSEHQANPLPLRVIVGLLLSGMRLNELCSLTTKQVRQEAGVWVYQIEEGKTDAATRLVPIHPVVLPIVLAQKNGRDNEENLWGIKAGSRKDYGAALSKWLNPRIKKAVPRANEERLVVHSLRHGFITGLKHGDQPVAGIKELVGHANSDITTGLYGKPYEVPKLAEILQSFTVHPVVIEAAQVAQSG